MNKNGIYKTSEKEREYRKKYYRDNIEKEKKYKLEYLENNRQKINNRQKKYNNSEAGKSCKKRYKENNPEKYLNYTREHAKRYYHNNSELMRKKAIEYRKKHHGEKRAAVLKFYSGDNPVCACCGEPHNEFLTIDHINGGGNKHRKEVGNNIYNWLVKNNFPPGFRVLCMNCNLATRWGKKCPHEIERQQKQEELCAS